METVLRLAIQKSGRLSEESLALLKQVGIRIENGANKLKVKASRFPLEVLFLRNSDIPRYIEDGVADIGIVGSNLLLEQSPNVKEVTQLGFSKCRVSLAVPKDVDYPGLEFWQGKEVATSYPNTLKDFFRSKGIEAGVHVISGSVEVAPSIGLADGICDIVSSGNTLFVNGLKEVETIASSEALLIAATGLSPQKSDLLEQLAFRFQTVLRSQDFKYVLLNCPTDSIPEIAKILPGMKSPTVLPLAEPGWSSLHSVIRERDFWENIQALRNKGAEGMLIVPIQKMVL